MLWVLFTWAKVNRIEKTGLKSIIDVIWLGTNSVYYKESK
jgi:hypothetical protein